jgi:hypothetical protein
MSARASFLISAFITIRSIRRRSSGHCCSSVALPVGHAFADKFSPISPYDVLLIALPGAHLTVLFTQCSGRNFSFALSIGHALPNELCPVSSCNILLHGLRCAHLAVLFA